MKDIYSSAMQAVYQQATYYSAHSLFETAGKQMLNGLTVASCNPNVNIAPQEITAETEKSRSDAVDDHEIKPAVSDCMTCNCCQVHFADREEQLGHYKCDWHRYNLHRRLKGLSCVSEEEFEETAGDVSSISGSDEDDERDDTARGIERLESDASVAETLDVEGEGSFVLAEQKFYKVFFKTKEGELLSLYRCLLHHKKNPLYDPDSILAAVSKLSEKSRWIILMVSSGHFAGTVFYGNEVIDHKTFHRYTVRAKRGTAQSTKDGQGGAPKSAGATLRRYNEAALIQDVQGLLSKWEEHIKMCDFVFVRIPVANRGMFFGGKNPAFKKDDPRIRVIPFTSRRPTFNETKRVHHMLASVECYGKETEVSDMIPQSPRRIYDKETRQLIQRKESQVPKSAKGVNKRQPVQQPDALNTVTQEQDSAEVMDDVDCQDKGVDMDLVETLEEVDFSGLKQFDSTVKKKHKQKKTAPAETQKLQGDIYFDKELAQWRNALFTACKAGCLDSVQTFLEKFGNEHSHNAESGLKITREICPIIVKHFRNSEVENSNLSDATISDALGENPGNQQAADTVLLSYSHNQKPSESSVTSASSVKIPPDFNCVTNFLNMPLSDDGTTFLHVAAKEGHADVVIDLLNSGADPAIKNKFGKTPYNLGESGVRNAFRRFMAQFPDRYDYTKAQIPSPLTAEMEAEKKQKATEKRKGKKKASHERNKDKKAAEAKIREENEEKDRFLSLSDREKRALAAEKRILQQHNEQGLLKPVLSRCWQCGTDMTGKVPFEYCDYKFCTTKCLREHRSKSSVSK